MNGGDHLFVYGTLRRSVDNEMSRFLAGVSDFVGPGCVRGVLVQLTGYTGLTIPTSPGEGEWIVGEVSRLRDPGSAWPVLDDYEGYEFTRQILSVLLDGGGTISASAYVYRSLAK